MATQTVRNKILTINFLMNKLNEILRDLYQKVSDGNLLLWLSVVLSALLHNSKSKISSSLSALGAKLKEESFYC